MKRATCAFLCLLISISLHGQGMFEFSVMLSGAQQLPPNGSPYTGGGTLTLEGTTLSYSIGMPAPFFFPTSARVHGPALPGETAAPVFDLGLVTIFDPGPGTSGSLAYLGSRNLTQPEISHLLAGLWYINLTSESFPSGELRGQITAVPEPSAWAMLVAGSMLVLICGRRKCRA